MSRPKLQSHGFTLVEMLLAISIYALLAPTVLGSFRSAIQIWERVDASLEETRFQRVLWSTLSQDLRNAMIYSDETPFLGQADQLSFMTRTMSKGNARRFELTKVSYQRDPIRGCIQRRAAGAAEGFDETAASPVALTPRVDAFAIRYVYAGTKEGELVWKPLWEYPEELPKGLGVTVDGRQWFVELPAAQLQPAIREKTDET